MASLGQLIARKTALAGRRVDAGRISSTTRRGTTVNESSRTTVNVAIVGAGPYGLSMAAHLRQQGIEHRIFGRPMDSWLAHMPKGMLLKSDGFASNIYDPHGEFTLSRFCAERDTTYADVGVPVSLETFAAYGLAFRQRMVPELEDKCVTSLSRNGRGFRLELEDGETLTARRVVLAVGITHFEYMPSSLAGLPPALLSHSFHHHNLEGFKGRTLVVLGGGSSAIDLAGLLRDEGAEVVLVARRQLNFHSRALTNERTWWERLRHPHSGLGPGLRTRFYADAPGLFRHLPRRVRLEIVRRSLGPAGGWFSKEKVVGRVPLMLGTRVEAAEVRHDKACLQLSGADGTRQEITADHIIAATGYKVDMTRLPFLSAELCSSLKCPGGAPELSSTFESSAPGLHLVGIAAANSFGPVMRFAFGAGFAARTVSSTLARAAARTLATAAVRSVAATAD
jgi:thioredoxin reductase